MPALALAAASPFSRGQRIDLAPLLAPTLEELWSRFPDLPSWTTDASGALNPLYPSFAQLEKVVVLGLNPSYNPSHRALLSYPADEFENSYFRRMAEFMNQAAQRYQVLAEGAPQAALAPSTRFGEFEWQHLDLLYMRTTSQQALTKQLWTMPGAAAFVWEQLQLTKQLLAYLEPTMLVIANGLGRTLVGFERNQTTGDNEWMGLQFTPTPDEFGAYRITGSTTNSTPDTAQLLKLIGTPVFFTGSFAGTNPRSTVTDEKLREQLAASYLREGDRYFEQWHR